MSEGLCGCGCGQRTRISSTTDRSRGWVKGQPRRFVQGHATRLVGHRPHMSGGYMGLFCPERGRTAGGYKRCIGLHVLIAERALGKLLPMRAEVHHVDENKLNNDHRNLVVCQDHKYHTLLHVRRRALLARGNANFLKCCWCGKYDDPAKLHADPKGKNRHHPACRSARNRRDYLARKGGF